jgi:hypothetical protein
VYQSIKLYEAFIQFLKPKNIVPSRFCQRLILFLYVHMALYRHWIKFTHLIFKVACGCAKIKEDGLRNCNYSTLKLRYITPNKTSAICRNVFVIKWQPTALSSSGPHHNFRMTTAIKPVLVPSQGLLRTVIFIAVAMNLWILGRIECL